MKAKFKLGDWLVDPTENTLSNEHETINIEPKAMSLLCLLCEAKGEVVTRDDIMMHIWNDRYVTDYALNNLISSLRKYLNSGSTTESYIKTRPKMGYQVFAEISPIESPSEQFIASSSHEVAVNIEDKENTSNSGIIIASARSQTRKTVFISLILLITLVLISYYQFFNNESAVETPEQSIAVLPFDVYDEKDNLSYFADGLADEIIHQLNTIANFKVISRRSSFSYRDKSTDVKQIAQELDVVYILEGSVREERDAIRTTVQLINTSDESIVWSRVFTASQENSFSIQHEISTDIARSMDASFTAFPEDSLRYTPASSEAYLHVLRGRKLNQAGNAEAALKARDEFLMATLLEPDYAMAYVNLAVSYLLLEQRKMLEAKEATRLFTEAIEKALSIDKDLAEAHAAYGIFYYNKNNFALSQASFEKSLAKNPKLYLALVNYANLLRAYYYPEESQALYERARVLAPLSGPVHWGLEQTSRALGEFNKAIESGQECVKRNPESTSCLMGLAYSYRLNMQHDKADNTLDILKTKISENDYHYNMAIAWHYLQTNKLEKANTIMEPKIAQYGFNIPLQTMTYVQVGLGQEESWLQGLSTVENPKDQGLAYIANYAHAAYFNKRCELASEYYELLLTRQPKLAEDADILANGVPYLTNLAYCQQQLSYPESAKENLDKINDILSALPTNLDKHPAILFVKTQHAILTNNKNNAQQYLSALENTKWGLSWLLKKDPIILSLEQLP